MTEETVKIPVKKKAITNLRWWIGGTLFASTVINYIDRQTLSTLAPFLKTEYRWTNADYALIVIAFRVAYAIGQTVLGRLMDKIGTRKGLSITVLWYSAVSMLTSFAGGLGGFAFFRFLLGMGESANWPAATKAVSEWFPKKERGWAVALFDSGSSVGAALAPFIVIGLYKYFGNWRPAFIIPGVLGLIWLFFWRKIYFHPDLHSRISDEERKMLLEDKAEDMAGATKNYETSQRPKLMELLKLRQTWGVIIARAFTDPVWFFIADWFMIFLVSKGFNPESALIAFWIPFIACDLGNFAGGGVSSWLIKKGWPVGRSRKAVVAFGGIGMTMLIPTIYMSNLFAVAGLFAISTFAYATFCTMVLVFPSDLYESSSVASVSGISGTAAGILTILSTFLVGWISDHYSFAPILIIASIVPLIGAVLVMFLIRNTNESGKGVLKRI
ncbi:MAG: MFS transporter [Acidobacteriota bacterium]